MPPPTSPERLVKEPLMDTTEARGPNSPPRKQSSPVDDSDDSGTLDKQPGTPLLRTYGEGFAQLRKYLSEEYSESTTVDSGLIVLVTTAQSGHNPFCSLAVLLSFVFNNPQ